MHVLGSPHRKEFRLLATHIDLERLHRECDRSHQHIKIEGKWTKPSATYCDDLAVAFGWEISKALRRKIARRSYFDVPVEGLESPVFNDVLLTSSWRTAAEWRWRRPAHINIHETEAVLRLLQSQAKERPRTRFSVGVDSHVALSALAKGRSPSYGLRPVLRRAAMTIILLDVFTQRSCSHQPE